MDDWQPSHNNIIKLSSLAQLLGKKRLAPVDALKSVLTQFTLLLLITSPVQIKKKNKSITLSIALQAFLQSLCGPDVTLLSNDNLSVNEQLANSMPAKDHMEAICTSLFEHVTSPDQSFASILLSLRMLTMLLDHDYGFYHLKW